MKKSVLSMWERIENNRYYIGSHLVGTFIGNDDIGYISQSTIKGGNGYRKTLKQTVQQLRNVYWCKRLEESDE